MGKVLLIYKSNGVYLGFISDGYIYSRDGDYLGWLDGNISWDISGKFRGILNVINGSNYILMDKFAILPLPRMPKTPLMKPVIPNPPPNITPIQLPVGFIDGF